MRNIYLFLLITVITLNASAGFSFPEKRLEWWNVRLKKIEKSIEKAKNSEGPYYQIAEILEQEKESAIKMVSVLDAERKNNGFLTFENKIFTDEELAGETDKTLKGIFSIYYLSLYSTESFNRGNIPALKIIAKKELSSLEVFKSLNDSGLIASETVEKKISSAQWKQVSFESMLPFLKSESDNIYSSIKKPIINELKKTISGKQTNTKEIENKILSLASQYFTKNQMLASVEINYKAVNNSSHWRLIKSDLAGSVNSNTRMIEEYKKQVISNVEYMQYIRELTEHSVSAALKFRNLQPEFENSIVQSSSLMNAIGEGSNLDIRLLTNATPEEAWKIKEIKKEFNSNQISCKKEISSAWNDYLSRKSVSLENEVAAKKKIDSKIAYYELESILNSAKSYAKYYERLKYSEEIISKLVSAYNILLKDAQRGTVTQELDTVIRANSILENIHGFNREKFESELELKNLIKKDIIYEVKILNRLMDDYRYSGISLVAKPTPEEIKELSEIVSKKVEARIGKIIFNEKNLFESDLKASMDLTLILNRSSWNSSDKNSGILFKIEEIGSEINLPYGWSEYTGENSKGVLREFNDWEGKSSISLNLISLENESLKDASDRWVRERDIIKLKSRWEKGNIDKYWFLAKTKKAEVVESYAFIKEGKAFILSVKCDKTRYHFLKEKLDELVSLTVK